MLRRSFLSLLGCLLGWSSSKPQQSAVSKKKHFPHRIHLSPGRYESYELPDGRQAIVIDDSVHEDLKFRGPGGLPFGCWVPCEIFEHTEGHAAPYDNRIFVSESYLWGESSQRMASLGRWLKLTKSWKYSDSFNINYCWIITENNRKQALELGAISVTDQELIRTLEASRQRYALTKSYRVVLRG